MYKEIFHCILLFCTLTLSIGCIRGQKQTKDNCRGQVLSTCCNVPGPSNCTVLKLHIALNGNLLEDATELYGRLINSPFSKVYEVEYLVLVVVHVKHTEEIDEQFLECEAMLKASELLTNRFQLPAHYNLQAITVVNAYDAERMTYDYVIAFRKESRAKMQGDFN